jgi:hypothetical protein
MDRLYIFVGNCKPPRRDSPLREGDRQGLILRFGSANPKEMASAMPFAPLHDISHTLSATARDKAVSTSLR